MTTIQTWLSHIAEQVIAKRRERKWNQDALERRSGVARKTISQIETAKNYQISSLFAVLKALGIEPWNLLGGTAAPSKFAGREEHQDLHVALQKILDGGGEDAEWVSDAIRRTQRRRSS